MSQVIENKLKDLGYALPAVAAPAANYLPYRVAGRLIVVSGQLPMKEGKPHYIGKVGREVPLEQGKQAAVLCLLNVLAHLRAACDGNLDRVAQCLRLGVFVNAAEDFTQHPQVANGASDLIVGVFGDRGRHARAAVGVSGLPLGVAVEIEGLFEIG